MHHKFAQCIILLMSIALAFGMEPELQVATGRLYFRLPEEKDVQALLKVYASDAVMQQSRSGVMTADEVKEKIIVWRQLYEKRGFCPLLVMRKSDDALIGVCGLTDFVCGKPRELLSCHVEMKIDCRFVCAAYSSEYSLEAARGALLFLSAKAHEE